MVATTRQYSNTLTPEANKSVSMHDLRQKICIMYIVIVTSSKGSYY